MNPPKGKQQRVLKTQQDVLKAEADFQRYINGAYWRMLFIGLPLGIG